MDSQASRRVAPSPLPSSPNRFVSGIVIRSGDEDSDWLADAFTSCPRFPSIESTPSFSNLPMDSEASRRVAPSPIPSCSNRPVSGIVLGLNSNYPSSDWLADETTSAAELRTSLDELRARLEDTTTIISRHEETNATISRDKTRISIRLQEACYELSAETKKNRILRAKVESASRDSKYYQDQLDSYWKSSESAQNLVQQVHVDLEKARHELAEAQIQLEAKTNELNALEQHISTTTHKGETKDMRRKLREEANKHEIRELRKEKESTARKHAIELAELHNDADAKLRATQREHDAEMKKVVDDHDQNYVARVDLDEILSEMKDMIEKLDAERNETRREHDAEMKQLLADDKFLRTTVSNMRDTIDELEKEKHQMKRQHDAEIRKVLDERAEKYVAKVDIDGLVRTAISDMRDTIDKLEKEKHQMKRQHDAEIGKMLDERAEKYVAKSDIDELLRTTVSEMQDTITTLEQEKYETQREHDAQMKQAQKDLDAEYIERKAAADECLRQQEVIVGHENQRLCMKKENEALEVEKAELIKELLARKNELEARRLESPKSHIAEANAPMNKPKSAAVLRTPKPTSSRSFGPSPPYFWGTSDIWLASSARKSAVLHNKHEKYVSAGYSGLARIYPSDLDKPHPADVRPCSSGSSSTVLHKKHERQLSVSSSSTVLHNKHERQLSADSSYQSGSSCILPSAFDEIHRADVSPLSGPIYAVSPSKVERTRPVANVAHHSGPTNTLSPIPERTQPPTTAAHFSGLTNITPPRDGRTRPPANATHFSGLANTAAPTDERKHPPANAAHFSGSTNPPANAAHFSGSTNIAPPTPTPRLQRTRPSASAAHFMATHSLRPIVERPRPQANAAHFSGSNISSTKTEQRHSADVSRHSTTSTSTVVHHKVADISSDVPQGLETTVSSTELTGQMDIIARYQRAQVDISDNDTHDLTGQTHIVSKFLDKREQIRKERAEWESKRRSRQR